MSRPLIVLLALAACGGDMPEPPRQGGAPMPAAPSTATPTEAASVAEPEPAPPAEAPGAPPAEPAPATAPVAAPTPATEPTSTEEPAPTTEPAPTAEPAPQAEPEVAAPAAEDDAASPSDEGSDAVVEAGPAAPAELPPPTYTIRDDSTLYVQVFKDPDTLAAALSHDHVVRAGKLSGVFTWDVDDASACVIEVDVPVSGLVVDPPKLRARVGLDGTLSDKQRGEVAKNMRAKSQLWGSKHPHIRFRSTRCESMSGGKVRVHGDLTIRGQTAREVVVLKIDADETSLVATGSFKARATDFGFAPFTAMAGTLKNRDEMTFTVKLLASAW